MATTTKRQALYTITLVEVTFEQIISETMPSMRTEHLRAMHNVTLHMRIGRRETRTPLLVDVPASEVAAARQLLECGVEQVAGERYIVRERQRGRVIREAVTAAA